MERRLIINLDLLDELDLSINEFCALWDIYYDRTLNFSDTGVNYRKLQEEFYIKLIKDEKNKVTFVLREKAKDLLEILIRQKARSSCKKNKSGLNVDILTRIPEFRDKWKGLKVGSMGSLQSCKDKLIRWMNENPDHTFDDVLKAADLYIESLDGDFRFLQRADYFVYKQENNREESSRLSAFIDELENGASHGEWTSTLN